MAETILVDRGWRLFWMDLDVSVENVLRRARLPLHLFEVEGARICVDTYFRLWEAFAQEAGRENLPLVIGRVSTGGKFNPAIFAALCSPDLRAAARRLSMFKRLLGPFVLDVTDATNHLTFRYTCTVRDFIPPLIGQTELVFLTQFVRKATRVRVCPEAVMMPSEPDDPKAFEEFFGAKIEEGPSYALRYGAEDASRPFLTANDSMWEFFEPYLNKRLADLEENVPFSDRVCGALLEMLPSGRSSLAEVARSLAMSTRTLQRRLGAENKRYKDILNHTREALARHYLTSSSMSPAEISLLLGYDDPNSFYRAFRQWTGSTPDAVRRQAKDPSHATF